MSKATAQAPSDDTEVGTTTPANDQLDAFTHVLLERRKEAISGRAQTGIEDQWREDQEYYDGIDDANREEQKYVKGASLNAPLTSVAKETAQTRSTVFLNVTAPYVDAASARVSDMLLPTDDRNWSIRPTPIPELAQALDDKTLFQPTDPATGAPAMDAQGQPVQVSRGDYAQEILDQAQDRCDRAQKRIDDWLTECQFHAHTRELIQDSTRLGSGLIKGPVPKKTQERAFFRNGQAAELRIEEKLQPASRRISCWDLFPDPACGESIHNGSFIWERDRVTAKQLRKLKGTPGYIDAAIDEVLEQGPKATTEHRSPEHPVDDTDQYEIWYYTGDVSKDDLEACGCEMPAQEEDAAPQVTASALVTMVNDKIIKAVLDPLESDTFDYDILPWKKKPGMPWGDGVARQIRTAQRMLNAGVRNMMDNAGMSSGPMLVINKQKIEPEDGSWKLSLRKIFRTKSDQAVEDVNKVFTAINIPSMQQELMAIIQFALKIAEDVTGLPLLMQGQQGKAPDTVGGMTILNNNASTVLRRIAKLFDDYITEPHIRRYYQFLLEHGPDDSEKGDMVIDARGSSALVERDLQNQLIQQLLPFSANPIYGLDPKKSMEEYLKTQHLDPKRVKYDDPAWQKIVAGLSQMAQKGGGGDKGQSAVQVAQIKEEGAAQRLQAEQTFEAQQNQADRDSKAMIAMIAAKQANLELNSVEYQVLEKLKAELGQTAMKLRTEKELNAENNALELHKHHVPAAQPPVQAPGRAADGHAFDQSR